MTANLINTILSLIELDENGVSELKAISQIRRFSSGEHWIREGQVPRSFGFVEKGLFRIYYADAEGNEVTKGFFQEGSFPTAYTALQTGSPSFFSIQALEGAQLVTIDYARWLEMYRADPVWKDFLIVMLTKGYMKKEKRERELLQLSAAERYRGFLTEYPGLESRIKQHFIASYLGITPVALSRIRKKMRCINLG
ncbi:Crp/Fnr family transcriptional regulator [Echinicola vietnamensis]|uniref:cAMP-binding protein n=1 Tax=Echinicola vietnamensis (strain DSM 17526 / LMG 23754 / KMM 6221) TaxID=926556 RepID=L0G0B4_ECHVK|nr:Crp/Fnr family transcriptional regulator [Echinicola vietnamensis]AGA78315.1 cAMP-binding protein [Echinicola vietnamensis DSM 17526]